MEQLAAVAAPQRSSLRQLRCGRVLAAIVTLTLLPSAASQVAAEAPAAEEYGPLGFEEEPWHVLSVGGPATAPTPLETLARSAMASAQLASQAASEAAAVATDISANRAAEAAEEVARGAETVSMDATRSARHLRDARTAEQSTLARARGIEQQVAASVSKSNQYLRNLGVVAQDAIIKSGIDAELVPIYKGMQEWKMAMLHPPAKEGRMVAVKEAKPYEQQLLKIENNVGRYQQKAVSLSNQASRMRLDAENLAKLAVKKQSVGDLMGARDDMMRAHQMMTHSSMIDEEAVSLHRAAQEENDKVPLYAVAAQNAAQEAMHRFDPQHFAPVPLGRGRFLRPPPVGVAAR